MRFVCVSVLFLYYFYKSTHIGKEKKALATLERPPAMHMELIEKKKGGLLFKDLVTGSVCCTWQLTTTLFTPQPVY